MKCSNCSGTDLREDRVNVGSFICYTCGTVSYLAEEEEFGEVDHLIKSGAFVQVSKAKRKSDSYKQKKSISLFTLCSIVQDELFKIIRDIEKLNIFSDFNQTFKPLIKEYWLSYLRLISNTVSSTDKVVSIKQVGASVECIESLQCSCFNFSQSPNEDVDAYFAEYSHLYKQQIPNEITEHSIIHPEFSINNDLNIFYLDVDLLYALVCIVAIELRIVHLLPIDICRLLCTSSIQRSKFFYKSLTTVERIENRIWFLTSVCQIGRAVTLNAPSVFKRLSDRLSLTCEDFQFCLDIYYSLFNYATDKKDMLDTSTSLVSTSASVYGCLLSVVHGRQYFNNTTKHGSTLIPGITTSSILDLCTSIVALCLDIIYGKEHTLIDLCNNSSKDIDFYKLYERHRARFLDACWMLLNYKTSKPDDDLQNLKEMLLFEFGSQAKSILKIKRDILLL